MADKKVKCPVCGKMNDKENTVIKNKRYYCPACLEQQQKNNATEEEKVSYEELMQNIKEVGNKIAKAGHKEVVTEVIEENLGVGKTFKDITKHQVDAAGMILDDLESKLVELGL